MYHEAGEDMNPTEYQNTGSESGGLELTDAGREEVEVERRVVRARKRGFPDPYATETSARHESFSSKLSGYTEEVERMGEAYMRNYKPLAELTDLNNMGEELVTQRDSFTFFGYSRSKLTLPAEGLDYSWFWVQRYGNGRRSDVTVMFSVSQLIRIGHEEGLWDGLRYALIQTDA